MRTLKESNEKQKKRREGRKEKKRKGYAFRNEKHK